MISVVCVYNDEEVLRERLLRSLGRQTVVHEVVTVDNRGGRFRSAAEALNHGAESAEGGWIIFAHQDISFLSDEWLARAENLLDEFSPSGWVGVAGMTRRGEFRGLLIDRARLLGSPFEGLAEVQTLDECLLIHKRERDARAYFDEALEGWHAYGVEACCRAIGEGRRNYVVALPLWHDSKSINLERLEDAHAFVWHKHGAELRKIVTTCGVLPEHYGREGATRPPSPNRLVKWGREKAFRLCGFPTRYADGFNEWLEAQTEDDAVVEVLHRQASCPPLEAGAFVPQPGKVRRVVHRFGGFDDGMSRSDCCVVTPGLARELSEDATGLSELARRARRLLVCLDAANLLTKPTLWWALRRRSTKMVMIQIWDGWVNYEGTSRAVAVFEVIADAVARPGRGRRPRPAGGDDSFDRSRLS